MDQHNVRPATAGTADGPRIALASDTLPQPSLKQQTAPTGWRDRLAIHPACELFPLMGEAKLREWADDIGKHGLRERCTIHYDKAKQRYELLDGRNRLDALELVAKEIFLSVPPDFKSLSHNQRKGLCLFSAPKHQADWFWGSGAIFQEVDDEAIGGNPRAYIISKNIHRRDLTPKQRREVIAKLLKANPEKSNRQIAKELNDDHKKVGRVREKLESTGAMPQLAKTTGKDGKKRPARKKQLARFRPGQSADDELSAEEKAAKASARGLAEFTVACRTWLPQVTVEADQQKARLLVSELTGVKPQAKAA